MRVRTALFGLTVAVHTVAADNDECERKSKSDICPVDCAFIDENEKSYCAKKKSPLLLCGNHHIFDDDKYWNTHNDEKVTKNYSTIPGDGRFEAPQFLVKSCTFCQETNDLTCNGDCMLQGGICKPKKYNCGTESVVTDNCVMCGSMRKGLCELTETKDRNVECEFIDKDIPSCKPKIRNGLKLASVSLKYNVDKIPEVDRSEVDMYPDWYFQTVQPIKAKSYDIQRNDKKTEFTPVTEEAGSPKTFYIMQQDAYGYTGLQQTESDRCGVNNNGNKETQRILFSHWDIAGKAVDIQPPLTYFDTAYLEAGLVFSGDFDGKFGNGGDTLTCDESASGEGIARKCMIDICGTVTMDKAYSITHVTIEPIYKKNVLRTAFFYHPKYNEWILIGRMRGAIIESNSGNQIQSHLEIISAHTDKTYSRAGSFGPAFQRSSTSTSSEFTLVQRAELDYGTEENHKYVNWKKEKNTDDLMGVAAVKLSSGPPYEKLPDFNNVTFCMATHKPKPLQHFEQQMNCIDDAADKRAILICLSNIDYEKKYSRALTHVNKCEETSSSDKIESKKEINVGTSSSDRVGSKKDIKGKKVKSKNKTKKERKGKNGEK